MFTEGDKVYHKAKIELSGLSTIVDKVFLFEKKLSKLDEIMDEYSNYQAYFIDDKASILERIKEKHSYVIIQ